MTKLEQQVSDQAGRATAASSAATTQGSATRPSGRGRPTPRSTSWSSDGGGASCAVLVEREPTAERVVDGAGMEVGELLALGQQLPALRRRSATCRGRRRCRSGTARSTPPERLRPGGTVRCRGSRRNLLSANRSRSCQARKSSTFSGLTRCVTTTVTSGSVALGTAADAPAGCRGRRSTAAPSASRSCRVALLIQACTWATESKR